MSFVVNGIVTGTVDMGTGDRLITIISPDRGRFYASARGARSSGSKIGAACQQFVYGNFEIGERKGAHYVSSCSIIKCFKNMAADLGKMALGYYVCELANELSDEGEECDELVRLVLNTLYLIDSDLKSCELIKAVFELRAISLSGYTPDLFGCVGCGMERAEIMYLDALNGVLICSDCLARQNKQVPRIENANDAVSASTLCPVSEATLAAIRYIVTAPEKKAFSFALTDERDMDELVRVAEIYTLTQLGRPFKTLDFYHSVK